MARMHAFKSREKVMEKRMKMVRTTQLTAIASLMLASAAHAAVISYFGADFNIDGTADDGSTTGWHSTLAAKPGDIDGNNALGSDGWIRAVSGGQRGNPTRFLPGYIVAYTDSQANLAAAATSRIGDNANTVGSSYLIDAPAVNGSGVAITSGISASNNVNPSVAETQIQAWHRNVAGGAATVFAFTIQNVSQLTGETLRVGLLFDGLGFTADSTQSMNITQYTGGSPTVGGASASSPQLAYRGNGLDVAYFDFTGLANGDKFVITADANGSGAIQSHLVGITFDSAVLAPEIAVSGNSVNITDGDATPSSLDFTDFGSTTEGAPITKTFRVSNTGNASLTTSGLTLPAGYSIFEGLSSSIGAGLFDDFTVQLDAVSAGIYSGDISFVNNDSTENPFNFAITGEVVPEPTTLGLLAMGAIGLMRRRLR